MSEEIEITQEMDEELTSMGPGEIPEEDKQVIYRKDDI